MLKDILLENRLYYLKVKKDIEKKISKLPRGSVKKRRISGRVYFYMQKREDKKVVHRYLGKKKPEELIKQIEQRRAPSFSSSYYDEAISIRLSKQHPIM